uniref:Uncharacterized protein n=1 Tax=Sphenodon punctatus TaxID=8508 RepID=A0A8D0H6Y6_SPHPU
MAEAVRPPAHRARAKPSRGKAKEKKKKEHAKDESDEVFLPIAARNQEVSSQTGGEQVGRLEELSDVPLGGEAKDRINVDDMCEIPLTSLTLEDEGSPTATLEPPLRAEEFQARPLQEKCQGNLEDGVQGKSEKPQSLTRADESANCGVSESSLKPRDSCSRLLMETVRDQETESIQNVKNPLALSLEEVPFASLQPSNEGIEWGHRSVSKPLYPDLLSELSQDRLAVVAVKPRLRKERLYPEIPAEPDLVAFTKEQLKILEPCSWLDNVDSYVEEFESVAPHERHEFHELLLNYWRCRKQLLLAEAELQAMLSDCQ